MNRSDSQRNRRSKKWARGLSAAALASLLSPSAVLAQTTDFTAVDLANTENRPSIEAPGEDTSATKAPVADESATVDELAAGAETVAASKNPSEVAAAAIGATDEIIVTARPIKDSLEASLELQRAADNVVNFIASDTIGRFPDVTAAAALARLPGIAVQRDQGQERYIQVRGAPARWTAVAFDGVNVLGAQERIFRFDSVPAVLIDSVALNKTLTPDMPSEALAGRVDVKTYSALDNPGLKGQIEGGLGRVDLGDGDQTQYAGRLSWANAHWGFVGAGSHYEFEQQTDNTEPRFDAIGMRELRTAKYKTLRETNSISGKAEYQPKPGHRISLTSLYTEFKDDEERNQYTFNLAGAASGTRNFDGADLVAVPVTGLFEKGNYKNSTFHNALRGDHQWAIWRGEWTLAYTETEDQTDLPLIAQVSTNPLLRPSVRYTTRDVRLPEFSLADTISDGGTGFTRGASRSTLNQTAFDRELLQYFGLGSKSESMALKFDLSRDWSPLGFDSTLKFGGQLDRRESRNPGDIALLRPDGSAGSFLFRDNATALGRTWTPFNFVSDERIDENVDRGYDWNYIDNPGLRGQVDDLIGAARNANASGGNFAVPSPNRALASSVDEDISAGYVMNTWKGEGRTLLFGLRVEHVQTNSQGVASSSGTLIPLDVKNRYTDLFPGVHFSMDLTPTLKARLAGVSGSSRPSFDELRANISILDAAGLATINGGNPELKPETAYGADGSLEWYFAPASLLALNGFIREVDDVLFGTTAPVGDDRFNFGGVDRSGYEYSSTVNGKSGQLSGVELTYSQPWTFLPGLLSGFGFSGSVAFLDGSFDTPDGRKVPFPGTSDRVTNLSVFYEDLGLSARLSYQHRTDWLDDVSGENGDIYWNAATRLDFSARYAIDKQFTVYVDANNLTDESGERYVGDESRPYETESFGRRYLIGLRASL